MATSAYTSTADPPPPRNYNFEFIDTFTKLTKLEYAQCKDVADYGMRFRELSETLQNIHQKNALPSAALITLFIKNLGLSFESFAENVLEKQQFVPSTNEDNVKLKSFNDILVSAMVYERKFGGTMEPVPSETVATSMTAPTPKPDPAQLFYARHRHIKTTLANTSVADPAPSRNYNNEFLVKYNELNDLMHTGCEDVADYGLQMLQLNQDLKDIHRENALPESWLVSMFIDNLSPRFDTFVPEVCVKQRFVRSASDEQNVTTFNDILVAAMAHERMLSESAHPTLSDLVTHEDEAVSGMLEEFAQPASPDAVMQEAETDPENRTHDVLIEIVEGHEMPDADTQEAETLPENEAHEALTEVAEGPALSDAVMQEAEADSGDEAHEEPIEIFEGPALPDGVSHEVEALSVNRAHETAIKVEEETQSHAVSPAQSAGPSKRTFDEYNSGQDFTAQVGNSLADPMSTLHDEHVPTRQLDEDKESSQAQARRAFDLASVDPTKLSWRSSTNPKSTIRISVMLPNVDGDSIRDHFTFFGHVEAVSVEKGGEEHETKCYVTFSSIAVSKKAFETTMTQGLRVNGVPVKIKYAIVTSTDSQPLPKDRYNLIPLRLPGDPGFVPCDYPHKAPQERLRHENHTCRKSNPVAAHLLDRKVDRREQKRLREAGEL